MENLLETDLTGKIGLQKYLCTITWRKGTFWMDEPERIEGQDLGPDPYTALMASLAGCTLSTLRMYIDRKGWNIPEISVRLNMYQEKEPELITFVKREISFAEGTTPGQKERLLNIAQKCPVSKILENKVKINTSDVDII